jgi:hypothetical protein
MDRRKDFSPLDVGENLTIGAALGHFAKRRYPSNTAKVAATAWGIELETAKNVVRGQASERSLAKAVKAEGYEVLDAIGEALTGMSRIEWECAKIKQIGEELQRATAQYDDLVSRAQRLADLRPLRASRDGIEDDGAGPRDGGGRSFSPGNPRR